MLLLTRAARWGYKTRVLFLLIGISFLSPRVVAAPDDDLDTKGLDGLTLRQAWQLLQIVKLLWDMVFSVWNVNRSSDFSANDVDSLPSDGSLIRRVFLSVRSNTVTLTPSMEKIAIDTMTASDDYRILGRLA